MPDKTTLRNEEIFRYWSEYALTLEDIASRFNLTLERGRHIVHTGGGKSALQVRYESKHRGHVVRLPG